MLYQPLESLTYTTWAMEGATAGASRCFEVLDRQHDVVDSPNAVPVSSVNGAIAFRSVSFGYAEVRHVLRDVHLQLERNQIVGVVGRAVGGQGTLLRSVP